MSNSILNLIMQARGNKYLNLGLQDITYKYVSFKNKCETNTRSIGYYY